MRPCARAGRRWFGLLTLQRKYGEHCIADEFQHLAAAGQDRLSRALEKIVQQIEVGLARQRLHQRRRVTQIAIEDRGADILAIPAMGQPPEHLAPRPLPEIGVEKVGRVAPQREHLVKPAQNGHRLENLA